jgi:Zn-finger nucleic acid-binding protein
MRSAELRYPCPVCLGVKLGKLTLPGEPALVLDYCERCGGIWFDEGEVERLRRQKARALWAKVRLTDAAYRMKCHNCQASMDRSEARCAACGWTNTIDCPACAKALTVVEHEGVQVDICRRCHGAWFDNVELGRIWNRTVDAVGARRRDSAAPRDVTADGFFLPNLLWLPVPLPAPGPLPAADAALPPVGEVPAVGEAAGGGLFAGIGDALGSAVDWTGDLAGGVFGGVADIFDGIDF